MHYYEGPSDWEHLHSFLERLHKRAIQILVSVVVVVSIVGSAALGVAVLITSQASYNSLSEAIEKVWFCIQSSTSYLEQQIDSSRNGSTRQKRIKLATPKTSRAMSCLGQFWFFFYVNCSGAVKNSPQELKVSLLEKNKERLQSCSSFHKLFDFSPWLTTLISAITSLCVINMLIRFIRRYIFFCITLDSLLTVHAI